MKRIIQGLVLATFVSTAQASPFPESGDPVTLPAQSTYADMHAGKPHPQLGSAIPESGDPVTLPAKSTYADRFAGETDVSMESAIPGNGDPVTLPAQSTYADQFAAEQARHAARWLQ